MARGRVGAAECAPAQSWVQKSIVWLSVLSLPSSLTPSLHPSLPLSITSHPPSQLTRGELRSPQQVSRDSPFRIQAQKMRQNRFFPPHLLLLTPLWAAVEMTPVPLMFGAHHPSLGDTCMTREQSQGPSLGGCAPASWTV